jgi:hypothetical protein
MYFQLTEMVVIILTVNKYPVRHLLAVWFIPLGHFTQNVQNVVSYIGLNFLHSVVLNVTGHGGLRVGRC